MTYSAKIATPCACPAAVLARTLLEVWLSGDGVRLDEELIYLSRMPDLPESPDLRESDESDRASLLKSIAARMKASDDCLSPGSASPRAEAWLSLLHHLSNSGIPII